MTSITPLTLLISILTLALAQEVARDFSFGYDSGISPNSFAIPGWSILGEGYVPQLLSDKVILTPPYGDNKRGALWTEQKSQLQEWTVQLDFRAGGTDRASGNMALWYVADGVQTVSTSSIYTVKKFDGLALVVDTASGTQKIRGFLNDGTIDYRSHSNVGSLAFGHCDYNYRNLGRASSLVVRATSSRLEVLVDDKPCFSTSKIALPQNYNFGLTAASGGPPDSFEAFKFLVKSIASFHSPSPKSGAGISDQEFVREMPSYNYPTQAPGQTTQEVPNTAHLEKFSLLVQKHISDLLTELERHTAAETGRFNEILARLPTQQSISQLESRLSSLESKLKDVSNSLSSADHTTQFAKISRQLEQTHQGIHEHLPGQLRQFVQDHTPRVGFMIFSFIAFQCGLVVLYVFYKRRRWGAPKKYL